MTASSRSRRTGFSISQCCRCFEALACQRRWLGVKRRTVEIRPIITIITTAMSYVSRQSVPAEDLTVKQCVGNIRNAPSSA